jgi:hypothetical protein
MRTKIFKNTAFFFIRQLFRRKLPAEIVPPTMLLIIVLLTGVRIGMCDFRQ